MSQILNSHQKYFSQHGFVIKIFLKLISILNEICFHPNETHKLIIKNKINLFIHKFTVLLHLKFH